MLSKRNRVSKEEFNLIFSKGRSFHTPSFLVKFLPVGGPKNAFAVVVPSKITPKASRRNYLRRVGYEAIRAALHPISGSAVFILKKSPFPPSKKRYSEEIRVLFKKIEPSAIV